MDDFCVVVVAVYERCDESAEKENELSELILEDMILYDGQGQIGTDRCLLYRRTMVRMTMTLAMPHSHSTPMPLLAS